MSLVARVEMEVESITICSAFDTMDRYTVFVTLSQDTTINPFNT